ncbi:MAG: hypothetical protein ABEH56_05430 [Salinirussus sp.]
MADVRDEATIGLRGRGAIVYGYFRRLLSPPLPGDGLLVVGFVEGLIGWPLSYLLATRPGLAPFGVVQSVVVLWLVLTAGIVAVGVVYTAPMVRQKRVWLVWGVCNGLAAGVNLLWLFGGLPADLARYGLWRPWLAVFGVSYLATAGLEWGNPQLRVTERAVYALAGVVSLAVLATSFGSGAWLLPRLFLVGGLLHLVPMGYDVLADVSMVLR